MTDVDLDARVTALEENGNYDQLNSKGDNFFHIGYIKDIKECSKYKND